MSQKLFDTDTTPNMEPMTRLQLTSHFVYMNNVVAHYPL